MADCDLMPREVGDLVRRACPRGDRRVSLTAARPRPNLDSGAHAAGIYEAKGAQPSGRSAAPLRVAPKGA